MFDPEKVGRWLSQAGSVDTQGGTWVKESDYDQLLELYRKGKAIEWKHFYEHSVNQGKDWPT